MTTPFFAALHADGPAPDRAGRPDSFLWRGEISTDEGKTWKRVVEFTAKRA